MAGMTPLEAKLLEYQTRAGQWLERKRALDLQAKEAGQNAEMIQHRIAGIQEAIELMKAPAPEPATEESQSAPLTNKIVVRKRSRTLSGNWQQIMQLVDGTDSFNYEALAEAAELTGHPVGRDTLRSQMSLYKQSGLVEAVGDGMFRLTDAGRKASGIAINAAWDTALNEIGPSKGEPEDGPNGPDCNPERTLNLQPPND